MGDGAPQSPLSTLLVAARLSQHTALLKRLGYDVLEHFGDCDDEELGMLKSELADNEVSLGHRNKILRIHNVCCGKGSEDV